MTLLREFGLSSGGVLAAVGAGGKTSLLLRLLQEAREAGLRAILTSTTHMGRLPTQAAGPLLLEDATEGEVRKTLAEHGALTLLGKWIRDDKLQGLSVPRVDSLAALADIVLVEADGARGRSLKLPAPYEPVLPETARCVVVLAGLDVVGAPLDEGLVHRLPLVVAAAGLAEGAPLDVLAVARIIAAPEGYRSRMAPGVRWGVFLNKAEGREDVGSSLARKVQPFFSFVAWGSARGGEARFLQGGV